MDGLNAVTGEGRLAVVPLRETNFLERNLQVLTMLGRTLPQTTRDFLERLVTELEAPVTLHPPLPPAALATGTDRLRSENGAGGPR